MLINVILWASLALLPFSTVAETVFKCKQGDHFAYQSDPCAKGSLVESLTPKISPPDPASLQRLEQAHLDYLKQNNPDEYRRVLREKLPPNERLADERAEAQERLQQQQNQWLLQQQAAQQQALLGEMEARRQQEWQIEQERLAVERQQAWQRPIIVFPQAHRPWQPPYGQGYYPQPPRAQQPFAIREGMVPPMENRPAPWVQPPEVTHFRSGRLH